MPLGLIAQRGNQRAVSLADEIRSDLADEDVRIDAETATALDVDSEAIADFSACDLVVSIGGDGTLLYAARHIGDTPIMGINLGEVGFLTTVSPADATDIVRETYRDARVGELTIRSLPRLVAHGDDWRIDPALNEVIVHAPERGGKAHLSVNIQIDADEFDRTRVDGVMVATPAGSTAYNLSERGPLMYPEIEAFVVNEMCARDGRPPVLVPLDAEISVQLGGAPFAHVVGDGRAHERVDLPTTVTIERAEVPLHMTGPPVEFFRALDRLE